MAELEEKTEAPTPRRREEARRRGQFARSDELAAAGVLLAAMLLMQITGPRLIAAWKTMMTAALSSPMTDFSIAPLWTVAKALAPLLIGLILVAILLNMVQAGFALRVRAKLQAIDPARGWDQVFSRRSAMKLIIHLLKIVAAGWVAWSAGGKVIERIVSLQQLPPDDALAAGATTVFGVGVRVAVVLLVLALIDYAWQRWMHERELRMTRREIKDELRLMEGDPMIKRRRRELAAGRMN